MASRDNDSPRVSRRRLLYGTGALGTAGLLAGCTGGDSPDGEQTDGANQAGDSTESDDTDETTAAQSGGELVIGQTKGPIEFDPMVVNDIPSIQVLRRVFSPLYTFGEGFDPVPHIAADAPEVSREGSRYVVPLKSGPTFHNGDPVTAADVKYSFEVPVTEETPNAGQVNMIDAVSIVDDQTVQFDLKYPYAAFQTALVWEIVPKAAREADKQAFNTDEPIGSGPFRFESWTQGDYVELTRWDDYWGTTADVETVRFTPITEPTTRVTVLRTGDVDMFQGVPPKTWTTVENIENTEIQSQLGVNYYYVGFNCKAGAAADALVREGVDYTVDLDRAVENFIEPAGERMYSPVPQTLAEQWEFPLDEWQSMATGKDIDEAKRLFDESDAFTEDDELTIIVPPDDKRESIGISIANGVNETGYNASVQRLDWGAYLDNYISGDPDAYNVFVLGSGGGADPDDILYYLFTHEMIGVSNGTFYRNETMDDALMTARQITDRERRRELYITAIEEILSNRVHLPVYGLRETWAVSDYVENYSVHPYGQWNPRLVAPYGTVGVDN
nr:ABC transporter substrate-binding protein [Salinirubrum litoreum]